MKINTTYNYNEDIGKTTKHTPSAFNADGADIAKFHHDETVVNGLKLRKNILD